MDFSYPFYFQHFYSGELMMMTVQLLKSDDTSCNDGDDEFMIIIITNQAVSTFNIPKL